MTYAGHFANALGNLNPKQESQAEESGEKSKSGNWVKWRILILRTWAVDPEKSQSAPSIARAKQTAQEPGHRTLPHQAPLAATTLGQDLEESQFLRL